MKRNVMLLCAALGMLAASAPTLAAKQPTTDRVTLSTTRAYGAGSAEAKVILHWVASSAPKYSPALRDASVELVRKAASPAADAGGLAAASAVPAALVFPPPSALPGDTFTVASRDPMGSTETWAYTYSARGAGWVLVEYHYTSATLENQDRTEAVGG